MKRVAVATVLALLVSLDIYAEEKPVQSPLEKQLESIVIPMVLFQDAQLIDVVEYLHKNTKISDPDKQRVNFVVVDPDGTAKPITLKLENVPLKNVVKNVGELSGLDVTIEKSAVKFSAKKLTPLSIYTDEKPVQSVLKKKLESIVIPMLDFRNAQIIDGVEYLRQQTKISDPDKQGVNFVAVDPDGTAKPITLKLVNVPLKDVVKYMGEISGLDVTVEESTVKFSAKKK